MTNQDPLLTLNNGVQMPAVGLGVFQSSPKDTVTAVASAMPSYRGGEKRTFDDPVLQEIARRHGKSVAQVMLRWHVQEGRSAIPKSTKAARIAGNFDVFDFQLSSGEIAAIDALDSGVRGGPEPDKITHETFGREIPEA